MPSARDCAHLLLDTIPHFMRRLRGSLRDLKVAEAEAPTMEQFRLLDILSYRPRTGGELAAKHGVTPSTMSRSIDVLVQRAWVNRQSDPDDRRQVVLQLTDAGKAAHTQMVYQIEDKVTELLEQLDDDDRARLFDGMRVLHSVLERRSERDVPDGEACAQRRS